MNKVSVLSAVVYLGISAVAGAALFLGTGSGNFTLVERAGAAAWVFILANIILMPIVIPWMKKRSG
jgi:hypothetical protein